MTSFQLQSPSIKTIFFVYGLMTQSYQIFLPAFKDPSLAQIQSLHITTVLDYNQQLAMIRVPELRASSRMEIRWWSQGGCETETQKSCQ